MKPQTPVFALVAGETSGDLLGAEMIAELKSRHPDAIFVGIGGEKMQAQGLESWFDMEQLSVMGFFEVLKRLRSLLKLRKSLIERLLALRPDVFIGIDAPDFNFTVERQLKAVGITTVHYVGPSVWAWREKRLLKIKHCVDGVLTLFPFEAPIYEKYAIPQACVGHPLAQKVPEQLDKNHAKQSLGFEAQTPITALLPGSRRAEIEAMLALYLQVAQQLQTMHPSMQFIIPAANQKASVLIESIVQRSDTSLKIHLLQGQSSEVLQAADQALVTSGTATLEAALNRCPLVLAIKVHPISYWIMKRLATTQWVGLPNILAGREIVKELIQDQATVENLTDAMAEIMQPSPRRLEQLSAFEQQYQQLHQPSSKLAADAIMQWMTPA